MPQIVGLLGPGAFRLCSTSGVARFPGYGSLLTFPDSVLGSESVRDITGAFCARPMVCSSAVLRAALVATTASRVISCRKLASR